MGMGMVWDLFGTGLGWSTHLSESRGSGHWHAHAILMSWLVCVHTACGTEPGKSQREPGNGGAAR